MKSITRSMVDGVKYKNNMFLPKTSRRKLKIVKKKIPHKKPVSKKRKVVDKTIEKKFLKRRIVQSSNSETDGETGVLEIATSSRRKVGGKIILVNIPVELLDNVSVHSEGNVQKWKYLYQRRIASERELSKDVLEWQEIMNLMKDVGLMNIVSDIEPYTDKLIKEFIVNISSEFNVEGSQQYRKVLSIDKIAKEITNGQVKKWPIKGLLSCGKLSVKYAVLNKIGATNWAPTNHSSNITSTLTMKHVDSCAVILLKAFPCLLTRIILNQYPEVLHPQETPNKKVESLTLDKKMFVGTHLPYIMVKHKGHNDGGNSSPKPQERVCYLR
ncbi:uncharacterized protein LOC127123693 [Lathyrus oleraceus]|uniref:uncharacterized protein LOC127123693 n=1 Tax=Pisum sativum TaxID=3888 RepID=UPI0021CEC823|nr:uncharacterized protein LOC127123693 [Pisum sativum]